MSKRTIIILVVAALVLWFGYSQGWFDSLLGKGKVEA